MAYSNVGSVTTAALVAAGATTTQTVTLNNTRGRGLVVVLNTVTASAGNTVQVTLNSVTASGYVYPLLVGLAVSTVAVTPLRVGVGLTPSANSVSSDVVPLTIQVVVTVVGVVSYGIDYVLGV